jgi:hypothetical protein
VNKQPKTDKHGKVCLTCIRRLTNCPVSGYVGPEAASCIHKKHVYNAAPDRTADKGCSVEGVVVPKVSEQNKKELNELQKKHKIKCV